MYPLAPEPSINYATMGVMIANMLVGAALQPSSRDAEDQEVEDYGTCLASYAKKALNITLDPKDWKVYAVMKWALEVAFMAMKRSHNYVDKLVFDQFFFVRFGRIFCGEELHRLPALRDQHVGSFCPSIRLQSASR
ncbi:hypothetical protein MRX96_057463 [Rhipicephalus microplus]